MMLINRVRRTFRIAGGLGYPRVCFAGLLRRTSPNRI